MAARPKRKAATNKTYVDTVDESIFEDKSRNKKLKPTKAQSSSGTTTPTGSAVSASSSNGKSTTPAIKEQLRVPYNWQPPPKPIDYFSNKLNLTDAYIDFDRQMLHCPQQEQIPNRGELETSDPPSGEFTIKKGDFIYMVSEPPGEPYYVGRVMGYKSKKHSNSTTGITTNVSNYGFQIQWFYRPRDISKSSSDSRLLFASMHTDTCPLSSFRGLVNVKQKDDIDNFDEYIRQPNSFYFTRLYDRYMLKFYDVISTRSLMKIIENDTESKNKSRNFITALNKRFEYIFVETTATKSLITGLTANSCTCEVCGQWCSNQDSVKCASCDHFYHMFCLDPPLLKKPSRGFSWTCAVCTKKHDMEYKNKKMLMLSHDNKASNEDEIVKGSSDDEEDESDDNTIVKADSDVLPKYELMAIEFLKNDSNFTFEDRRLKEEWCMRYLGMHAKLEDGVDLEDRSPYPRASTRIGAKHQAINIPEYIDHPIVYYDIAQSNGSSSSKKSKKVIPQDANVTPLPLPEEYKNIKPKDLPHWLQPRPKGYIERGVDDGEGTTCALLWKSREEDVTENFVTLDEYVARCDSIATKLDLSSNSPNFVDAILKFYMSCKGSTEEAFKKASQLTRKTLQEPTLTPEEIQLFEDGVRKNGSELYPTFKLVKTQPLSMIVRFYYIWKKTKNGRLIWGNFEGRKRKKVNTEELKAKEAEAKIDLYNDEDDSSYDGLKISAQNKRFCCKHCHTEESLRWFRITGVEPSLGNNASKKKEPTFIGLCFRCARLWRRYAVIWEEPLEVDRKVNKTIGGWKRKIEFELLRDANEILLEAVEDGQGIFLEDDKENTTRARSAKKPNGTTLAPLAEPVKKSSRVLTPAAPKTKAKPPVKVADENKKPKGKKTKGSQEVKVEPTSNGELKSDKKTSVKRKPQPKSDKPPVAKRVKKETISQIINPFINKDYIEPANLKLSFNDTSKISDSHPSVNGKSLEKLSKDSHLKALVGFSERYQALQNQYTARIALQYDLYSRGCTVCGTKEDQGSKVSEVMACANCGVNVHASCAGVLVPPSIEKPVKQWLCNCCVNDLRPNYSTLYSCCLCYATETKNELSYLGSEQARPDLLYPILESGRWCHLTCALFNYSNVDIRPNPPSLFGQKRYAKEDLKESFAASKAAIEGISQMFTILGVSDIFLNNYHTCCGICKLKNGAMIGCAMCEGTEKYHISCATDKKGFKIGFKLVDANDNDKEAKVVKIGSASGRLEPALVCNHHDHENTQSVQVFGLRELGKRYHSSTKEESKPLIQLFMEDVAKHSLSKFTGPQLKAHDYLKHIKMFVEKEAKRNPQSKYADLVRTTETHEKVTVPEQCSKCSRKCSPIWWKQENGSDWCQSCYHRENQESEATDGEHTTETPEPDASDVRYFADLVNAPISAENSGLQSIDDKITEVYKPINLHELRQRTCIEPGRDSQETVTNLVK